MSGNEALALGAFEAGVKVASGYPGTPSTEILENLCTYEGVYTEWAPNEKVGLEVAIGACFAGVRALATMKHVGVNVAADPLFTASYTGVCGGLVLVTADDPEMHSSQNEQDNRNYAFAAKLPMFEPSDPMEAKEMLKAAFEMSEELDTPVMLRITTRVAHVKGVVSRGEKTVSHASCGISKVPAKLVMLPSIARKRREVVEERMRTCRELVETASFNRIETGDTKRGFITSGVSYLYVKEAFPEALMVFIEPPSLEVLEARLRGRGDTDEEQIARRLGAARWQMGRARGLFDHFVVNDSLGRAIDEVAGILTSPGPPGSPR